MRNSHKNRIETSSSRFYSVCNAKASGLFLGEGLLEREKEGKEEGRGLIYMVRERGSCPTFTILPWFIRSWVRGFFPPHRFAIIPVKKSEHRSIVIDGSIVFNSQDDQISFVDVSPSIRARNVIFLEDLHGGKSWIGTDFWKIKVSDYILFLLKFYKLWIFVYLFDIIEHNCIFDFFS